MSLLLEAGLLERRATVIKASFKTVRVCKACRDSSLQPIITRVRANAVAHALAQSEAEAQRVAAEQSAREKAQAALARREERARQAAARREASEARERQRDLRRRQLLAFGMLDREPRFECGECQRWARVAPSRAAHAEALEAALAVPPEVFGVIRVTEQRLRPSVLERDFGRSYDEAVAALAEGERLGVLVRKGREYAPAPPLCDSCYARRRDKPAESFRTESGRDPIPPQLRFKVLKRDNFTCQYCGAKAPSVVLQLDHVVPVASGGETSEGNLLTACETCNSGKSTGSVI